MLRTGPRYKNEMTTTATAAVLHEAGGEFRLQDVALDDLRADEVRVRIEASGICHTDISSEDLLPLPAVFGHEGAGIVEEIGSGVSDLKTGDRVIISYSFCNHCPNCDAGRPYICDSAIQSNFGGTRLDGTHTTTLDGTAISAAFFQQSSFATRSITQARNTVKVTHDMGPELLAPLGCGIMTGAGAILNTMKVPAGASLVVFGAGAVGLSAIMAARIVGVNPIIAVDIVEPRLELARELGATHSINASAGETVDRIMALCPRGAAFSFETSGVESALNDAIDCLAMGGKCGMVTVPHYGEKYSFTPYGVFVKAATLEGVFLGSAVPNTFLKQLIDFHRQGMFPYHRMIKTYPFNDINHAIADAKSGHAIKPVLLMD